MRNLATIWTQHIDDPEKKEEFVKLLRNSTMSLSRMNTIVKQWQQSLLKTERSVKVYENPNWAHRQAHANGMLQAWDKVTELLSFIEEQDKDARQRTRKSV